MTNVKYVIRQRHFFYNDEGQYLTDPEFDGCEGYGEIEKTENSLQLAQQYCEQKNIQFMRAARLGEYCPPCENNTSNYPSQEYKNELENFLQQYGHDLCDANGCLIDFLPENLPDAAVLEFAKKVNILGYEVMEFEEKEKLFALWLNREQKYFGYSKILTYSNPDYFALVGTYIIEDQYFIVGTLQELSDAPDLLKLLIENNPYYFLYETNPNGILITTPDTSFEDLLPLNALLKEPIFEIRQITLEQLNQITVENKS